QIASQAGSVGVATITGTGSSWVNNGALYVGHAGGGTLTVEAGGEVTNGLGLIGALASSTSAATVTGPDSRWVNSGELIVGVSGRGTLTIAGGGLVSVGGGTGVAHVGHNAGATGVLNIGAAVGDAAAAAGGLEAGEVRFGAGTGALNFNHTGTDYVFTPLITGPGALNHYAGTTLLTADNTYTGDTSLHGGTLVVE